MKIFITGASGFIGSALTNAFSALGHSVTAISRNPGRTISNERIRFVDAPIVRSMLGPLVCKDQPDALIHCVGAPTVGHAQLNPCQDFAGTVLTVSEVLESLREKSPDTLFVLVSSASVYGDRGDIKLCESIPPRPISTYGYNKWMAELLVEQYATQYGLPATIIRPFSIYGESLRKQVIFDLYKKLLLRPDELLISGTGNEIRDFVHIDDVVLALIRIVQLRQKGVINVATGIATSISELAVMLQKQLSVHTQVKFSGEAVPNNPTFLVGDTGVAQQIGISHSVTLGEGLMRLIAALPVGKEGLN